MLRYSLPTLLNRSVAGWASSSSRCSNCDSLSASAVPPGSGGVLSEHSFGKFQKGHQHFSRAYSTTSIAAVKVKSAVDVILESLTSEDTKKVLNVVNEIQRSEDFVKYFVPKKKADDLIKMKYSKGDTSQISSLEDVVSVIGPKNSTKFICSVLDRPAPISMSSAMFPIVTTSDAQRISNVLSVAIVGDKISWSVIKKSADSNDGNIKLQVESMQQVGYPFKPRMHILTLLNEMEIVAKQIPNSELCITEEYPVSVPTPYMFNFQLQMAQAKSLLLGLLSSRENPPTMISIKTIAVARIFNTFVGSERVSGQHILENMLTTDRKLMSLDIEDSTLNNYNSLDVKVKEGLSHSFLLNMAYWKLTKQVS